MKNILIGILLISILWACQRVEEEKSRVDLSESEIVNDWLFRKAAQIDLVPLEYKGYESLVLTIRDVITQGGEYYVVDSDISDTKSIKKFDGAGKFKGVLKDVSFEYRDYKIESVSKFKDGKLLVLDESSHCFVLNSDLLAEEIHELPFKASKVAYFEDSIYFYSNRRGKNNQGDSLMYDFVVYDSDFNFVSGFDKFEIPEYSQNVSLMVDGSFSASDKLLYSSLTGDTIYSINSKGKSEMLKIAFQNPTFSLNEYPEVSMGSVLPILQSDFSWGISNLVSYNDYVFFNYYDRNSIMCAVVDMRNAKTIVSDPKGTKDDADVLPWPRVTSDGFLLGWYSGESLKWFNNIDSRSEESILYRSRKFIDASSNPVLVKYKIQ
ncbi:hypothetical protein PBT90_01835 [Algoriphagus halophytocola]|uniref:6-bladed beta-propeller n=1 Tax=Algoriphagus halophytocola TaxID=2991499 RepID=A0ABY6MGT3_9BACT|nr:MULTISPECIES: hypothetical protein [unclassified Algoriphagus]UZD22195.1 hypothetical protein OM944_16160 [Algoriphagus sp. TR-M5]WBL43446.1 hypothetical protein PBT90_01835 [Algoriphagus sp. TR-M9]